MAHVATITIDHTKVPGDLTDYVGLIVPDGSAGYAALYALCLEGGGDIRLFKSDDTTELPREVVSFSVSAETGEIHYRYAGTLSSSVDTDIHVYADGSSSDYAVSATYGRNAVWVDYELVSHDGGGTDSAGNYTPSANGGVTIGGATGKIGNATDFDGSNDYIDLGNLRLITSESNTHSVSMWFQWDATNGVVDYIYSSSSGTNDRASINIDTRVGQKFFSASVFDGSFAGKSAPQTDLDFVNYFHTAYSYNASLGSIDVWLNSTALTGTESTGTSSDTHSNISGRANGDFLFNGRTDEFRVRESVYAANWITTEYNNQNANGSFWEATDAGGGGSTPAQAARRGAVMMM